MIGLLVLVFLFVIPTRETAAVRHSSGKAHFGQDVFIKNKPDSNNNQE
jgi:hypothetical protein